MLTRNDKAGAVAVGFVGFAYRLLTHRGLPNDQYMHLSWAQQLLAGDLPGRDFVDPGFPLMYALSAMAQQLSPGPWSEAVLSSLLLGIAAGFTCLAVTVMTRVLPWGIAAALLEVAFEPRLYSYPKVLVPAVTLAGIYWLLQKPSTVRVTGVALWTVAAALLRYDMGVYAAAGVVAAIVAGAPDPAARRRAILQYIGAGVLIVSPWLLAMQLAEGLPRHLAQTRSFTQGELHQLDYDLPVFDFAELLTVANATTFFVYLTFALVPLGAIALWRRRAAISRESFALALATLVMLIAYLVLVLRYPLEVRIRDLATLIAVLGAWLIAGRRLAGQLRIAIAAIALFIVGEAGWTIGQVEERLDAANLTTGYRQTAANMAALHEAGTTWPWDRYWPAGPRPDVVRYVDQCTAPTDRVFLTWSAPEFYFFMRRAPGGGQSILTVFGTEDEQRQMIDRLKRHAPPLIFINESRRDEFEEGYPQVDAFVRNAYTPSGTFRLRDESEITIARLNSRQGGSTYESTGWPCF